MMLIFEAGCALLAVGCVALLVWPPRWLSARFGRGFRYIAAESEETNANGECKTAPRDQSSVRTPVPVQSSNSGTVSAAPGPDLSLFDPSALFHELKESEGALRYPEILVGGALQASELIALREP